MLQLGTLLALACALATNVAMLCKHRGAVAAPTVRLREPVRRGAALYRSRWWAIGFAIAVGALLLLHGTSGTGRRSSGPLLAIAAGLLLGVANVSVKALTGTVPSDLLSVVSPWTLAALVAGVGAFFGLARGMQLGEAIPVIAITSVAANCASVAGGVLVFGDPVGSDPIDVVARCLAFAAVIAAVALMPAPRTANAQA